MTFADLWYNPLSSTGGVMYSSTRPCPGYKSGLRRRILTSHHLLHIPWRQEGVVRVSVERVGHITVGLVAEQVHHAERKTKRILSVYCSRKIPFCSNLMKVMTHYDSFWHIQWQKLYNNKITAWNWKLLFAIPGFLQVSASQI